MAADVEICNLALSHLGLGREIQNLETDRSQEAVVCRRYYAQSRDSVLRDFPWPFATVIVALALVQEQPNIEWKYSYRVPADELAFRRILSGMRMDSRQSRVPYRIVKDAQGLLAYTDMKAASGEYTQRVTDTSLFAPDFVNALSFRIAMYAAPRLTAGDPFKLADRAAKFYEYELSKARAMAINEQQDDVSPESEFLRAREGDPTLAEEFPPR